MKHVCVLVILAYIVLTQTACKTVPVSHPGARYHPMVLKEELSLLKNILEANHPSLYWYTSKDSLDNAFAIAHASIIDSLTEREFKNKVAWVMGKIRCGHTVVRHSKQYSKAYAKARLPVFPLAIKVWEDSAVLVSNLHRNDSILTRGTIITGINQRSMNQVTDSISQLMSADGYIRNFKHQLISFNFGAYYTNAFGLDSQYIIHYLDSSGRQKHKAIHNFYPRQDSSRPSSIVSPYKQKRKERRQLSMESKRSLQIDTALNTAMLSVNTFSEGRLITFFRRSFRKVKQSGAKNLVLDLRLNSGGNVLASTRLTQYLADKPFRIADTVAAITRKFPHRRHIRPWFLYWISMQLTGKKMQDDRIHFRYFEKHSFKPKKRNHFDGNIYIVAGGYTFSAAAMVASTLSQQSNVTVVGEETGGGAYGNSAMHLPVIILPKTKIRVSLPMYRLVFDSDRKKEGRGIMPDVEVNPSSALIRQGIDGKLFKVKELISSSQ